MPTSTSTASRLRDPVDHYSTEVLAGRIVAGKLVRLACQRHLDDRKNCHKRGLYWDKDAALWAINFFPDVLLLPEVGSPFYLEPWEQFIVGSLFGWKQVADDSRRFRQAYIEVGKGNGKSPLAGGIGIYMLAADGEQQAQCFAAATTQEQAHILFQDAVKMVESSPKLRKRILTSGKRRVFNLAHSESGSFFRPVSSEHRALDGKRVHYAALDEIHEHPDSLVVDKIRAGTKGRRQALIFEITNSGYDRHSICWAHHQYSEQVLEGNTPNDQWFAYVCQLDEKDDWHDPAVWIKANPNLGVSIPAKYLEEQIAMADGIPGNENIVKRLNFCIWTEQSTRWMPMETWDGCNMPFDIADLAGQDCYGGLDLSSTTDLSALCLMFPPAAARTLWCALWYFWAPAESIAKRSKKDGVPYDIWAQQGFLRTTPGNITDYRTLRRHVSGAYIEDGTEKHDPECLADKFHIVEIAYDRWNATQLITELGETGDGLTMVPLGQGFQSMSAPMKEMERLVVGKLISHGGNPIARWCASNVSASQDPAGNIKPDKAKSTERIDGISAMVDAIARAMLRGDNGPSVYETRGLLTI